MIICRATPARLPCSGQAGLPDFVGRLIPKGKTRPSKLCPSFNFLSRLWEGLDAECAISYTHFVMGFVFLSGKAYLFRHL
ncbi:MAG: hypothetical protein IPO98_15905 [Saprospiraceae bacterium]|nr:hypothetical protein [Saprospiraceae bacterium]